MDVLTRPNRDSVGGGVHTANGLMLARMTALRAMDAWCEIQRPQKQGGGFGEAREAALPSGRVWCAIAASSRGQADTPQFETVETAVEYEITMNRSVRLDPDDRIAVPAFFPLWQASHEYSAGEMVAPTNFVSGSSPFFKCQRTGSSGVLEPEWPTKRAAIVFEDAGSESAVWRLAGYATLFEVIAVVLPQSQPTQLIARCQELN